jgi:SAM-dependent methyltransferase
MNSLMQEDDILGLSRHIGDRHYRAYIGPPDEYDLVSAMSFNLLTSCGLRQHHRLLDIGCGSLRVGRLLIPYLNAGNYFGLEPNRWLVEDGLRYEVGSDILEIRKPVFIFDTGLESVAADVRFDYVIAQSIFSHTAPDLLDRWMRDISYRLDKNGILFATVLVGEEECVGDGWIYPECVEYRMDTVGAIVNKYNLGFHVLDWYHPRQTWCAVFHPGFNRNLLNGGAPSWSNFGALRSNSTL